MICRIVFAVLPLMLLAGCATSTRAGSGDDGPRARCTVCQHNADLACVDVRVTDATPRLTRGDQTYYFCSEQCRAEFAKHPTKYAAR